ncbi:MAG: hypothetical protein K6G58_06275 [Lachnospiraceae bacterium]|nr:hypothetical protein [Lachnospiraceae bacterium]
MKRSGKIALWIIIGVAVIAIAIIFMIIHAVFWFLGYKNPVERYYLKLKTDVALEMKYPEHDFDVRVDHGWGEYGYSVGIYGMDENGIEFWVHWVDDDMQDKYHEEWNEYYYGEKIVEYQDSLRDKYFPQIPYVDTYEYSRDKMFYFYRGSFKEVFFESMNDAIEGSKENAFNTDVTYKGIDIYTADDEELQQFAESIADSLMWLYEETGYYDIRINDFHYRGADEDGAGSKTKEELADSIIKSVMVDRKIRENRSK